MKKYPNGLILLDIVDIICIAFFLGSSMALIIKEIKRRNQYKGEDPIVGELKEKSPMRKISRKNKKLLKVPMVRGGDLVKINLSSKLDLYSKEFKSRRISNLLRILMCAQKERRVLYAIRYFLFLLHIASIRRLGLSVSMGSSLGYVHVIVVASTSSIGGFIMTMLSTYPVTPLIMLSPLLILVKRFEFVPDVYERCRILCEAAKEYYNNQLKIEMKGFNEEVISPLKFEFKEGPLECTEKGKLYQRYLENKDEVKRRVQYYTEFLDKFPECKDLNSETLDEIIQKLKLIKIKINQ